MRATAFDHEAAAMMGIDVNRVIAGQFFIGSGYRGCGRGDVRADVQPDQPLHGVLAGLKGFTAAVVGGIGSIPGAMLGGPRRARRGLRQGYLGGQWSDIAVFAILIIVLLVRPTGPRRPRDPEGVMDRRATGRAAPEPVELEGPRVGVDEWALRRYRLEERPTGVAGCAAPIGDGDAADPARDLRRPRRAVPLWLSTGDLFTYGIFVLLYVLLGLGLNTIVGFAGLLDLGYVAFFGFGAYFYAILVRALRDPLAGDRHRAARRRHDGCWASSSASRRVVSSATTWRS